MFSLVVVVVVVVVLTVVDYSCSCASGPLPVLLFGKVRGAVWWWGRECVKLFTECVRTRDGAGVWVLLARVNCSLPCQISPGFSLAQRAWSILYSAHAERKISLDSFRVG